MLSHARERVRKNDMSSVQQRDVGDFRVYAGTFAAHGGGYTASVEVHRMQGARNPSSVVFSKDCLAGGHRFETPEAALRHALDVGHQIIRLHDDAVADASDSARAGAETHPSRRASSMTGRRENARW